MRKKILVSVAVLSLFGTAALLGGCGSAKKEGQNDTAISRANLANAAHLGDQNCQTCHGSSQDLTMIGSGDGRTIFEAWRTGLHHDTVNGNMTVHCEDCHGGGQFHWGLGPLPHPNPQSDVCLNCHGNNPPPSAVAAMRFFGLTFRNYTGYLSTAHANRDQLPDRFFFQGGTGTSQAEYFGQPEFVSGTTTPVTKNQHIEQCSVCHSNNQRFVSTGAASTTGTTDTTGTLQANTFQNLSTPQVSCASCHDAHQIGVRTTVGTGATSTTVILPAFRKSQIAGEGTWNTPSERVPADPAVALTAASFSNTELICAACHTKGQYKYSRARTHNDNVYSQWSSSAHNDRIGVPFNEVSVASYPLNLRLAGTSQPGTCAKCHNGLSAISFMQPSPTTRRPVEPAVVFNQATATCITCHDPHKNGAGHTENVRTPTAMTNYSGAGTGVIFGNVFLDTQPIPNMENPNSSICIFCHQGRESGLTLFMDRLRPGRPIGTAFKNPHYLGVAGVLWGANGYEFPSSNLATSGYTSNAAHQRVNCTGCHMANQTEPVKLGGHTWRPNPASCTGCHPAITATTDLSLEAGSGFLATNRATSDTTNYSGNTASVSIASQITDLQNYIMALLASRGVFYDDTKNSYFFNVGITVPNGTASNHANANLFTAWTPELLKAAFNLALTIKANPSAEASTTYVLNGAGIRVPSTSQTLFPNKSAAVHNYKYIIQLLMDSYTVLYNSSTAGQIAAAQALINAGPTPLTLPTPATLNAKRPAGTRQAVNYNAYDARSPGINPVVTYGGDYGVQ